MPPALYRKYRPMTFADVTDQNHVKITLQNQIANKTVAQGYIFAGPRGVGKTTIARILAKALNCQNRKDGESEPCNACSNCEQMNAGRAMDIIEIDAASHTGVENVRETIIDAVRFAPSGGKWKTFIIDEVHMLSKNAFNALLKTIEEPPANVLFILATTEIHKIPQTILSRCQRFDFHRIAAKDMVERLKEIAKSEGVTVDGDVLAQIARLSEGCLRDAETLLGQVFALGEKHIGKDQASIILPVTNTALVADFVDAVSRDDVSAALNLVNEFVDQGGSVRHLTDELVDFSRTMLLLGLGGPYHDHYEADVMQRMEKMFALLGARRATAWLDAVLDVRAKPMNEQFPQVGLEVAVVLFCGTQRASGLEGAKGSKVTEGTEVKEVEKTIEAVKAPQDAKAVEAPATPAPQEPPASAPADARALDLEDLKSKWGRCCEVIRQRSIALPLGLMGVEFLKCENNVLEIGFKTTFHHENVNQPKNLGIIAEAINQVMQSAVTVAAVLLVSEEEKTLGTLVEAFGGQVVD